MAEQVNSSCLDNDKKQYDEIDIVDLIKVVVRQKKIIIATVALALIAAVILAFFVLTPQYEIGVIVKPGITGFNDKGQPVYDFKPQDLKAWIQGKAYKQMLFKKYGKKIPNVLVSLDKKGSTIVLKLYHNNPEVGRALLKDILNLIGDEKGGLKKPRRLVIEQLTLTKFIESKLRELKLIDAEKEKINADIEKLKLKILLLETQKKNLENEISKRQKDIEMVDVEKIKMEKDLALLSEKIKTTLKHIEILKENYNALATAKDELRKKIQTINKNTNELIKLRNTLIQSQNYDKIALLMYSNIIQENITYVSNLEQRILQLTKEMNDNNDKINQERLKIEKLEKAKDILKIRQSKELDKKKFDIEIAIQKLRRKKEEVLNAEKKDILAQIDKLVIKRDKELEKRRRDLEGTIKKLTARRDSLSIIQVIQSPYASPTPVKPRKRMILALALVSSLFIGLFLAFLKEFWEKNKIKV